MDTQLFINGIWLNSQSHEVYTRVNPAAPTEVLGEFQKGNAQDSKAAIEAAVDAYEGWANTPAPARANYLIRAGELLEQSKDAIAQIVTREMGKTLRDAKQEVQQAIDLAYYVAGEGRRLLGHTTTSETTSKLSFTMRLPIGVVGLITPWNFPIVIAARKIFYSLVCGNTIVHKPSSEAPMSACMLAEILRQTGIPKGVFNCVTGPGDVVGNALVTDRRVRLVSFCGHKDTGAKIMHDAGPKRVSLELGGKNPLIILDDADLDLAADGVVWGGYATTGQRCTATSRVIVHEKIRSKLKDLLLIRIRHLKLGNGLDSQTDIGPLVNRKAQQKTQEYCDIAKTEGAKLLVGGNIPKELEGFYFEPTLFSECQGRMRVCQEEIFGPVVCMLSVADFDEAIKLANDVDYGLSSAVYTKSLASALEAMKRLEAGLTYVNHPTVGCEAHLPFGGVKYSGNNRESGPEGTDEFSELKTVYINYSRPIAENYGAP